jgi:hypothetical protein
MNKKYNIQEFIDNDNLVIKCDDLFELRKVGKYLWNCSTFKIENFNPTTGPDYPYIVWYSKTGTNFNPLRVKYPEQIIINFEDVIFEEFVLPEKWLVKAVNEEQDSVLTDYINKIFHIKVNKGMGKYKHVWFSNIKLDSHDSYYSYDEKINNENLIEITFDQFKKYVLKQFNDYSYLKQILIREGIV